MSDLAAPDPSDLVAGPVEPGLQSPELRISRGRSRLALGVETAGAALMATGFFHLAWDGISTRAPGHPLYSALFDLVVPLVLAAMGVWLAWWTLFTGLAVARADEPWLTLTDGGIEAPLVLTRAVPWGDIATAWVYRPERRARVIIEFADGSKYYRRFWPFWRAWSINLYLPEPDKVVAAIRRHPGYRGAPAAAEIH